MPPGFLDLHPNVPFNFLMNRLAATNPPEALRQIGARIANVDDWIREMVAASTAAEAEGRLLEAAHYLRGAEFYMATDHPSKASAYERFHELHDKALPDVAARRDRVPFRGGHLPVIDLVPMGDLRGTLLAHSGFDGLVEEMVGAIDPLVRAGYRVIAFEGPGQGAALRHGGLHMEHDWEKPVAALLDHYDLETCTLIGMSLGGYLAPRAAAFEPRIQRVVAWGAMYDFMGCFSAALGPAKFALLHTLVRLGARTRVNAAIARATESNPLGKWAIGHGMHVSGAADPFEYLRWLETMNLRKVSDRIRQDVLLVMGTEDHLVPFDQLHQQTKALTNARSISVRVATAEEQGAQHCQIGNTGLVIDEILRWMEGLDRRDAALKAIETADA